MSKAEEAIKQFLQELENIDTRPKSKAVSREAEAEIVPWPKPRPNLVCFGGRIVGKAVVVVSPSDPNWWKGPRAGRSEGVVIVGGSEDGHNS